MSLNQTLSPHLSENCSVIFFGGDVNLGRRMNLNLYEKPFGDLPVMREADLRIINLECVVAAQGHQGIDKKEGGAQYYHARPEQINLLTEANIDVVLTANNHAMDYYGEALLEQNRLLERAGILHCGSGANVHEASRPVFVKVNDLVVAIFNVSDRMLTYAATEDKPGIFCIHCSKLEQWKNFFTEEIAAARKKADVVLVGIHWGVSTNPKWCISGEEIPLERNKILGRLLIDCGADAVLGCHSHILHGVETYNERPIIYDAGNFLYDYSKKVLGGGFSLAVSKRGVEQVFFTPLLIDCCKISAADAAQSAEIGLPFLAACQNLDTVGRILEDGTVKLLFEPPEHPERNLEPVELPKRTVKKIPPMSEPLPQWTPAQVPEDARIEPKQFGPIKLVGCRIPPECLIMKKRQLLFVETWWTLVEPTDKDLMIRLRGVPVVKDSMPNIGGGMDHQACDWMWPTNRWKQGVIYYERFGLRPPSEARMVNVDVVVPVLVLDGKTALGKYIHPTKIKLQLPDRPSA